ncbi:mercury resistance system periplasmic binding protein MerP [Cupriavidus sp. CP313]
MQTRLVALLAAALASTGVLAASTSTVTLDVGKMDCAACPITMRIALEKVPGVESAKVDYKTRRAVVTYDPTKASTEALTAATAQAGYPSTVRQGQ